jgi:8-oxo-dGTP diphosphatase
MIKKAPEKIRFAAVAIDVVLFGIVDGKLSVLLGTVNRPPYYTNIEAVIGGLLAVDETTHEALQRHVANKTHLSRMYTEQLYTFSGLERDKRNRVISISYLGLVRPDDAARAPVDGLRWCPVTKVPQLAFDHNEMCKVALTRLQGKIKYTNLSQFLLPKQFTLSELQTVYELVLGKEIDKRNFRKKILALDMVIETGELQAGVKNRPAALYRFKTEKPIELSPII